MRCVCINVSLFAATRRDMAFIGYASVSHLLATRVNERQRPLRWRSIAGDLLDDVTACCTFVIVVFLGGLVRPGRLLRSSLHPSTLGWLICLLVGR